MHTTIITLWKNGNSKASIAKQTGCDWKTVNKVIVDYQAGNRPVIARAGVSLLDKHQVLIEGFLEHDMTVQRVHEELIENGVTLSYSAVRRYIVKLRGTKNICIRFHTLPAKESQVDFGYVGKFLDIDGKVRKTYAFCMTLSYSRYTYVALVFDQKVETFLKCHLEAFKYFGGVPAVVKIDNLKSGVLEAHFYEPIIQEQYKNFANSCDFGPIPCKVRSPKEKGKVESAVKYVQTSFINGRTFESYDKMQKKLKEWLDNKCNVRIHGTTRAKPIDLFKLEEQH